MDPRQRKLFELRLKLNETRKANQQAVIEEKKRNEAPEEYEKMQKKKSYDAAAKRRDEERVKQGIDPSKKHLMMTAEEAAASYKKKQKKYKTAVGGEIHSKHNLYQAYDKRTKNIQVNEQEYETMKNTVGERAFYADPEVAAYGGEGKVAPDAVDRMVAELEEQKRKRLDFSRRRKYYEERDVDHINDRNAHFNKKIERAFGEHTKEIKANLERGTALPDH